MDTTKRFERILLATDGSEASKAAVDATIAIAKSPTARVKVAHVWNLEVHHRHGHWDVEVRSEAEKLVDVSVERLLQAGVIAEREIIRADSQHVAAAIACSAKAFEADLVVIGSRGLSDWQSLRQHSVSHQLLCGLDCPVLIVRGGTKGVPARVAKVLLAIAGGDDLAPGVRAVVAVAYPDASVLVVHVAQAIVDFDLMGIELVAIAEGFDMTNPRGRAMIDLASMFAKPGQSPRTHGGGDEGETWRKSARPGC